MDSSESPKESPGDIPSQAEEFITLDECGNYVAVNYHTGEERLIRGPKALLAHNSSLDPPVNLSHYQKISDSMGQIILVPKDIPPEEFLAIQGKRYHMPYNTLVGDRICQKISEGMTLVDISKEPGMPTYSQLSSWRRTHPDFNEAYVQARKDRAEIYFHKIMEEVESAQSDRDSIALARLKTDIYKFAAKVCSPDEYAEKSTLDARVAVGSFTIETGIRRENDSGFNPDHTKEIVDGEE